MTAAEVRAGFSQYGTMVNVPVTNTYVAAQPGCGKTSTLIRMAQEAAALGYTMILLDVKDPRDFDQVGIMVPAVLRESTDPVLLLEVLQGMSPYSLRGNFGLMLELTKGSKTIQDVRDNMDAAVKGKRTSLRKREAIVKLLYFMDQLLEEIKGAPLSQTLELRGPVNVMDLHSYPDSVQRLVVDSVLRLVLKERTKTVVVLEEAIRFVPERGKNEVEGAVGLLMREGRANQNWLWLCAQTISGISKATIKAAMVWILGRQLEKNECRHVADQVPGKKVSPDEVKMLETGWFYVVTSGGNQPTRVRKTFTWPAWMKGVDAMAIAKGQMDVNQARPARRRRPPKEQADA